MSKTLYMETTSISVIKTCAEIEEALLSFGVKQFWKEYENQSVSGIAFIIEKEGYNCL